MSTWCLAHPWMTFFLGFGAFWCVAESVNQVCVWGYRKKRLEYEEFETPEDNP